MHLKWNVFFIKSKIYCIFISWFRVRLMWSPMHFKGRRIPKQYCEQLSIYLYTKLPFIEIDIKFECICIKLNIMRGVNRINYFHRSKSGTMSKYFHTIFHALSHSHTLSLFLPLSHYFSPFLFITFSHANEILDAQKHKANVTLTLFCSKTAILYLILFDCGFLIYVK